MQGNWINKIHDHETTPHEGAWKHIVLELDKENESNNDLKTKLLNYETAAPVIVLQNIFAQLDTRETKIIALDNNNRSRKLLFIKITAAAAVIAIITLFYFNNKSSNNTGQEIAAAPNKQPTIKNDTGLLTPVTKEKTEPKEIAASPVERQQITRQKPAEFPGYIQGNTVEELATNPVIASTEKLQNTQGDIPMDMALMNTPNSYVSITGPDGQSIKLSSKLSGLAGYLNGSKINTQENLDVIIKESAKWREIFAAWRNKMANNGFAPSLTNFMDIIELSEILEDN